MKAYWAKRSGQAKEEASLVVRRRIAEYDKAALLRVGLLFCSGAHQNCRHDYRKYGGPGFRSEIAAKAASVIWSNGDFIANSSLILFKAPRHVKAV